MSRAEQRRLIHDAGARLGTYLRFVWAALWR